MSPEGALRPQDDIEYSSSSALLPLIDRAAYGMLSNEKSGVEAIKETNTLSQKNGTEHDQQNFIGRCYDAAGVYSSLLQQSGLLKRTLIDVKGERHMHEHLPNTLRSSISNIERAGEMIPDMDPGIMLDILFHAVESGKVLRHEAEMSKRIGFIIHEYYLNHGFPEEAAIELGGKAGTLGMCHDIAKHIPRVVDKESFVAFHDEVCAELKRLNLDIDTLDLEAAWVLGSAEEVTEAIFDKEVAFDPLPPSVRGLVGKHIIAPHAERGYQFLTKEYYKKTLTKSQKIPAHTQDMLVASRNEIFTGLARMRSLLGGALLSAGVPSRIVTSLDMRNLMLHCESADNMFTHILDAAAKQEEVAAVETHAESIASSFSTLKILQESFVSYMNNAVGDIDDDVFSGILEMTLRTENIREYHFTRVRDHHKDARQQHHKLITVSKEILSEYAPGIFDEEWEVPKDKMSNGGEIYIPDTLSHVLSLCDIMHALRNRENCSGRVEKLAEIEVLAVIIALSGNQLSEEQVSMSLARNAELIPQGVPSFTIPLSWRECKAINGCGRGLEVKAKAMLQQIQILMPEIEEANEETKAAMEKQLHAYLAKSVEDVMGNDTKNDAAALHFFADPESHHIALGYTPVGEGSPCFTCFSRDDGRAIEPNADTVRALTNMIRMTGNTETAKEGYGLRGHIKNILHTNVLEHLETWLSHDCQIIRGGIARVIHTSETKQNFVQICITEAA